MSFDKNVDALFLKLSTLNTINNKPNLGPLCWYGLTLIQSRTSNDIHYTMCSEITFPFPNFNSVTIEVWNGKVISFHILQVMWLLIHATINVKPCY